MLILKLIFAVSFGSFAALENPTSLPAWGFPASNSGNCSNLT
jgi:hypothetical protein